MKLKKVVSLALAGVLAVSMLAGCGTDKKPGTGEGEGEGTVTGYSAKVAEDIDSDLDYVTFKDNAADQADLKTAVASLTDASVINHLQGYNNKWLGEGNTASKAFMKAADIKHYNIGGAFGTSAGALNNQEMNVDVKTTAVYVADGTASMDKILQDVAASLEVYTLAGKTDVLAEQGTANGMSYDYSYVVSVSVVTRTAKTSLANIAVETPVTFIAVTVTRTGTPAKV